MNNAVVYFQSCIKKLLLLLLPFSYLMAEGINSAGRAEKKEKYIYIYTYTYDLQMCSLGCRKCKQGMNKLMKGIVPNNSDLRRKTDLN